MKRRAPVRIATCMWFACLVAAATARADTALGDAGHYLTRQPPMYLNNPQGRPFTLSITRFVWWIGGGWNRADCHVRIWDPDGEMAYDQVCEVYGKPYRIDIPTAKPGVYRVDVDSRNGLNFWYLTSSLDQAVLKATLREGDTRSPTWCFNPFVPRKWHFFVPVGTQRFTVRALNTSGRSHREDHGLTVFSPRGQRMAVLWGQANPDAPKTRVGDGEFALQEADIIVELGSAGRFWAIEVRAGDSHTYSDINVLLDGIPPYLARSPEEWFDPATGHRADVVLYDDSEFVQSDRPTSKGNTGPIEHWTPCPTLGDPDADELLCPARIALWNPADRELRFVIGTYLPRNMFPSEDDRRKHGWDALPEDMHEHAQVLITGPQGDTVLKERAPLLHLHGHERWDRTIRTGKGVAMLDVTAAENFWTYTYPGTPAVMIGQKANDGWQRFRFQIGTARNWYFFVPRGTGSFAVQVAAAHDRDVIDMEINAPDRTVARLFANKGQQTVAVPAGLDGHIWHVRLDIGGGTTLISDLPHPRFPSLAVTLDLKGVPGLLAPTWEQWFDPADPKPAHQR